MKHKIQMFIFFSNEWIKQLQKAVQEYKEKKNALAHTINPGNLLD